MSFVADFFRRYGGVPANDAGPIWSQATEETLLAWFNQLAPIVRCGWNPKQERNATPDERRGSVWIYNEVLAEVRARAGRPGASPEIMAAQFRASLPNRPV